MDELFSLALEQFHAGRLELSEATCQQRLQQQPNDGRCWHLLGAIYGHRGRHDQSIVCLRKALEIQPNNAPFHLELASMYLSVGDLGSAALSAREAIRLRPELAGAHVNLGCAVWDSTSPDESIRCFQNAIELQPDLVIAHYLLGELALQDAFSFSDRQIGKMRGLLEADLNQTDRIMLQFALGWAHHQRGDHDAAFEYCRQANESRWQSHVRQGRRFSAVDLQNYITRMMKGFDSSYFKELENCGSASALPVFVVGMPRSGKTLVEQILSAHTQVHGGGERQDIPRVANALVQRTVSSEPFPEIVRRLSPQVVRELSESCLVQLKEAAPDALHVVNTLPDNYLYLGLIATLFPRARVIYCDRDARDVGLDCYFRQFRQLDYVHRLEDLGDALIQYRRLMEHWQRVLPIEMLVVKFDRLIEDTADQTRQLLEYCDLGWEDGCLNFFENRDSVCHLSQWKVRRPIRKSAQLQWRSYEQSLQPLLEKLADPDG